MTQFLIVFYPFELNLWFFSDSNNIFLKKLLMMIIIIIIIIINLGLAPSKTQVLIILISSNQIYDFFQ
jgi:hypothetical protein